MKPNIVLVNCDDLGYGDLGCYGSKINKTPYLDKMASEGIKFTDFYMMSPVCSPSRGGMMTSCYPPRIEFSDFDGRWVLFPGQSCGLNPKEKTIANVLKTKDYSTKIIGKWHLGDQKEFLPTKFGFDSYYGLPYSNDMGRQKVEDTYPPLPLIRDDEVIEEQPDQASLIERYLEQAKDFIKENKENPFFLYFAHMYVHLPIYPPKRFLEQSNNGSYGAAVECIDWAMGVLIDQLKKEGLLSNTLIIFTSDNGSRGKNGGSNLPLRGQKGKTWEGGMRVPCIMYWKDKIKPMQEYNEIACSADFMPTFASITGSSLPSNQIIDGVDLSDVMFNDKKDAVREVFYYYHRNSLEALRSGDWKLHFSKDGEEVKELYNLEKDISESNNVYEENIDIVNKLNLYAEEIRPKLGDERLLIEGSERREKGRVEKPDTLTHYDKNHPYMMALYDLMDRG